MRGPYPKNEVFLFWMRLSQVVLVVEPGTEALACACEFHLHLECSITYTAQLWDIH